MEGRLRPVDVHAVAGVMVVGRLARHRRTLHKVGWLRVTVVDLGVVLAVQASIVHRTGRLIKKSVGGFLAVVVEGLLLVLLAPAKVALVAEEQVLFLPHFVQQRHVVFLPRNVFLRVLQAL